MLVDASTADGTVSSFDDKDAVWALNANAGSPPIRDADAKPTASAVVTSVTLTTLFEQRLACIDTACVFFGCSSSVAITSDDADLLLCTVGVSDGSYPVMLYVL